MAYDLYSILTIKKAPASCGGGLFINGDKYVDDGYRATVDYNANTLTITSHKTDDLYVGNLDEISFDGKKSPKTIDQIIDWLKPGHSDVGGDSGFTVAITFNHSQFQGDGSDLKPITIKSEVFDREVFHDGSLQGKGFQSDPLRIVQLSVAMMMARLNPEQFYVDPATGLICANFTPGPTPQTEIRARRFVLDKTSAEISATRFILTKDPNDPEVIYASKFTLVKIV